MSEATQENITGTLKSIAEEEKAGKDVIVYQVMRDGMKFPDFITAWPDDDGDLDRPSLKKGERYTFTVLAKPKKDGKGKYLDYMSVSAAKSSSAAPAPAPKSAPRAPVAQEQGYDPTQTSIERQTALKAAVEIAVAHIAKGDGMPSANIVQVAAYFARFLATGSAPAPRVVEPEPREEDMEEELFGEERAA